MAAAKRKRKAPPLDSASGAAADCKTESAFPRSVTIGTGRIECGEMKDSSDLINDSAALRSELETGTGYLLLRNFLPRETVLRSRQRIVADLRERNLLAADDASACDTVCRDPAVSAGLLDRQQIAHDPTVLATLQHPKLFQLFERIFAAPPPAPPPATPTATAATAAANPKPKSNAQSTAADTKSESPAATADATGAGSGAVLTAQYKWLRAVKPGDYTGVHCDRVYMNRGSTRLLSVWCPIGDLPIEFGALCLVPGSHTSAQLAPLRSSYGKTEVGVDGTASGWVTDDPNTLTATYGALNWVTTDFRAGDICVFGLDVLHASATNVTNNCYRVSCDTRWQPADEPLDPRLKKYKFIPPPVSASNTASATATSVNVPATPASSASFASSASSSASAAAAK